MATSQMIFRVEEKDKVAFTALVKELGLSVSSALYD